MEEFRNNAVLRGSVTSPPVYSHSVKEEKFFTFPIQTERLSGASDTINVLVSEQTLRNSEVDDGAAVEITGELRSYNNRSGTGSRLILTVLARTIAVSSEPDENRMLLRGTVCKPPILRKTPMGRQICDIMLAVNRHYGRADYIPCIAWGQWALTASRLSVGDCITIDGRLQSRKYIKNTDGVQTERTAFEVSATTIE